MTLEQINKAINEHRALDVNTQEEFDAWESKLIELEHVKASIVGAMNCDIAELNLK